MKKTAIGIRREDKNPWERRIPLTPEDVGKFIRDDGLSFTLQPNPNRVFPDSAYIAEGARIDEDLSGCTVVLGVKEMPPSFFHEGTTYVFFSHVIKGQPYNMPMLQALLDRKCHLIDYEKIEDDDGKRLVFFGDYAGLAGMIDTLWALGARLAAEGLETPFRSIRQALAYASLDEAKRAVENAGTRIRKEGLPPALSPLVCGFAGYGNVSRGAQTIFDLLPTVEVPPGGIPGPGEGSPHAVYKTVFKEEDLVEPRQAGVDFALQDYYDHPEKYRSRFAGVLPKLTLLVNGVYWDARYPRLVTKADLRALFSDSVTPKLKCIGDISADLEGSIEATVRCTNPGNPVFVFDPLTEETRDGVEGRGPVILAVDNLPAELPREASMDFSRALRVFIPPLARADLSREDHGLPGPLRRALIVRDGALTPEFAYLKSPLANGGGLPP
ncbi:MAG: bifunctional lysine ketoglutarate reductase /saccharopine dehydrogenase family protein [Planctomycetota bacterium]|jgi:alpha-aminoadipic semialdehyde synthase